LNTKTKQQIGNWLNTNTIPVSAVPNKVVPVFVKPVKKQKKAHTEFQVTVALLESATTQRDLIKPAMRAEQHLENLKNKRERLGVSNVRLGEGKYDTAIKQLEVALETAYRSPLFR